VQHFRLAGGHARAFAGGEHDRGALRHADPWSVPSRAV
jgi:hypothetical protein